MKFLDPLDNDLKESLLNRLIVTWTHDSTAIEGNTLTLGETHHILTNGITISGHSLKEHNEVVGHADALKWIFKNINNQVTHDSIKALHKIVMVKPEFDIMKPFGDYKSDPNGTYQVIDGKHVYIEYSAPFDTQYLMTQLIEQLNQTDDLSIEQATKQYAKIHAVFTQIHPFYDGNGRIARIVANIPLLKNGFPPILITNNKRQQYIDALAQFSLKVGRLNKGTGAFSKDESVYAELEEFANTCYATTKEIIDEVYQVQSKR
ncbi:Fic family protein [Catenovulum sp. SX2]|uniref:Fic family protein n=1 Tax=Catenovulum sp. SX2 TaxID=3398614 RepID=UPI003F832552